MGLENTTINTQHTSSMCICTPRRCVCAQTGAEAILYASSSVRDAYSTLLGHLVSSIGQPLSDLTKEEVNCVCALLGVLEGGLHVAAVKAQDLEIQDSRGILPV